jgi:hypothetical protein
MNRVNLGDGRWFSSDAATRYEEGRRWDGQNHISLATRSQWDHEALWRTKSGAWVLHWWSQWQGSQDTWEIIDADKAARWLIRNGRDLPEELRKDEATLEL